jgi:hypothetical protein
MSKLRKLIGIEIKETGRKIAIYRNAEYNEWVVRFYVNGVHQADADYHSGDSVDAYDTANNWVNARSSNAPSLVPPVLI